MKDKADNQTRDMVEEMLQEVNSTIDASLNRIITNHLPRLRFTPMPTPVYLPLVWYVSGEMRDPEAWPTLLRTKADAEAYARELFPNDTAERRYSRIMYRVVEGEGQ